MDLQAASSLLRLLADGTRMRLLALLRREELTVAELAAITELAQPRVSTHLAKLREAGLVRDRRSGVSAYYRLSIPEDQGLGAVWQTLLDDATDPLLDRDSQRLPQILAARADANNWADSVAGDMERHYSPGRTWEATARAMVQLLSLGRVLDVASGDGVLAELLAPHADAIDCLDVSKRVAAAGQKRLGHFANVQFKVGDMHDLPYPDRHFDTVLLMHALTYSSDPGQAFAEAARVLRPDGQLVAATLQQHEHTSATEPFGHVNNGFTVRAIRRFCEAAGLKPQTLRATSREKRAPHFAVITLLARR